MSEETHCLLPSVPCTSQPSCAELATVTVIPVCRRGVSPVSAAHGRPRPLLGVESLPQSPAPHPFSTGMCSCRAAFMHQPRGPSSSPHPGFTVGTPSRLCTGLPRLGQLPTGSRPHTSLTLSTRSSTSLVLIWGTVLRFVKQFIEI